MHTRSIADKNKILSFQVIKEQQQLTIATTLQFRNQTGFHQFVKLNMKLARSVEPGR